MAFFLFTSIELNFAWNSAENEMIMQDMNCNRISLWNLNPLPELLLERIQLGVVLTVNLIDLNNSLTLLVGKEI